MIEAVVYQAVNLTNGHRYIGVTKQGLHNRRRAHLNDARNGRGHLLHQALRKYGEDAIVFSVLHEFEDYDLARAYEHELIAKERPAYNISSGGEGGVVHPATRVKIAAAHRGQKRTAEARANMSEGQRRRAPPSTATREKMRLAKLGKKHSPEVRARRVGRKLSEEHRRNISLSHIGLPPTKGRTGQPVSQETRERIRAALRAREWADTPARAASRARTGTSAAQEARKIPLRNVDDGREFESVKDAAIFYGFQPTKLAAAIRQNRAYRGQRFERIASPRDAT